MVRIGEIVKKDKNPFMVVSKEYEDIVKKLSVFNYPSDESKLLGCLIISQTEHQYKKYLIKVLLQLKEINTKNLIENWQTARFERGAHIQKANVAHHGARERRLGRNQSALV